MTVCVGIALFDGLVFAADSATTFEQRDAQGNQKVVNVYRNGNKVFNLVKGLPLVTMTCGMGNIGQASIAAITKDLRLEMTLQGGEFYLDPANYTMKFVADTTKAYFAQKYASIQPPPANPHSFEYWIAGYGSGSATHEIWKFQIVNGTVGDPVLAIPAGQCGMVWGGSGGEPIHRLVMGFSPLQKAEFVKAGLNQATADQLFTVATIPLRAQLILEAMPIQDAVEVADFLADVAKRYVRFLPGADTVGGDIDIAVVTRHERFKWVRRKHYYPAGLNPLETDHV